MIDQASRSIDQQVKSFEEQEKAAKLAQIQENYPVLMGWLATFIPFEKVMDPKWLNKSTSLASANKALEARARSIISDVDTIQNMHLSHETAALACYYDTLDLSAAMSENLRLSKLDLARDQQKEPVQEPEQEQEPMVELRSPSEVPPPEKPKTIKVIFYDTTAAFRAEMRALTDKYGVKYGGIR